MKRIRWNGTQGYRVVEYADSTWVFAPGDDEMFPNEVADRLMLDGNWTLIEDVQEPNETEGDASDTSEPAAPDEEYDD